MPWKQKLFSYMSRLWSECADNKLILDLERKAYKFPKSQLRLSLAKLSPSLLKVILICGNSLYGSHSAYNNGFAMMVHLLVVLKSTSYVLYIGL